MFGGATGRRKEHLIKFLKGGKSIKFVSEFGDVDPEYVKELAKKYAPKKKAAPRKTKAKK